MYFSSTSTRPPALASCPAAVSPPIPLPTTTASQVSGAPASFEALVFPHVSLPRLPPFLLLSLPPCVRGIFALADVAMPPTVIASATSVSIHSDEVAGAHPLHPPPEGESSLLRVPTPTIRIEAGRHRTRYRYFGGR
eukprot:scaffold625_cov324-Pavlova_lutheri.AAC.101